LIVSVIIFLLIKYDSPILYAYELFVSLHLHWFTPVYQPKVMKRESGVNPEQSRCCKL